MIYETNECNELKGDNSLLVLREIYTKYYF